MIARPVRVVAPTAEVITLAEVKEQARVYHSDQDALLVAYRDAAVDLMDGWTGALGRALAPQTWQLVLDAFPCGAIRLPVGPLIEITSIAWRNAAGAMVEMAPAEYLVGKQAGREIIEPVTAWPPAVAQRGAVKVTWRCGQPVAEIPATIKVRLQMLVQHWYDQGAAGDIPAPVESMIRQFRAPRT